MVVDDCYVLPEPSTSSESGVRLDFPGGVLNLYFDYDKEGVVYSSGIVFKNVRAHAHTAETHCPAWKIEASYDKLVRLVRSELVEELLNNTPEDLKSPSSMNHYMIYFDSDGCYEVVAEAWEVLPERQGNIN
jgi:hypothetical protein